MGCSKRHTQRQVYINNTSPLQETRNLHVKELEKEKQKQKLEKKEIIKIRTEMK